jgi:hypothetical protein
MCSCQSPDKGLNHNQLCVHRALRLILLATDADLGTFTLHSLLPQGPQKPSFLSVSDQTCACHHSPSVELSQNSL